MEDRKIRVAITHGDTNGVGYEVIFKALSDPLMLELCTSIIYGSPKVAAYYRNLLNIEANFSIINKAEDICDGRINLMACVEEDVKVEVGQPSDVAADAALVALNTALTDYNTGAFDVLVTAPVYNNTIKEKGLVYAGHTEFIEKRIGNNEKALKLLLNDKLRVALLTGNLPLKDVSETISVESIVEKIKILHKSLKRDFLISNPRIAVLALNPYCGDDGKLGKEETDIIIPAISQLDELGMQVFGPYAADDYFGDGKYAHFDAVLAMYHDQGAAPFRSVSYDGRVDFTAGMPLVRTAPDHTAQYEIAGRGDADETSMREAIYAAIDIFRNRMNYDEAVKNPLPKLYHEKKEDGEKVRFNIPKKRDAAGVDEEKESK